MSEDIKAPEEWTGTLYVCMSLKPSTLGEIEVWDLDMSGEVRILLHSVEITIPLPKDLDVREKAISSLQNAKDTILAEAEKKANDIQAKIDSFLQITYEATA